MHDEKPTTPVGFYIYGFYERKKLYLSLFLYDNL